MKKITMTADYTTTITREFLVDDDFNPDCINLNDMWYTENSNGALSNEEVDCAIQNLQMNEVWLVRNEKDEEIYVK